MTPETRVPTKSVDSAHGGAGWKPRAASFADELGPVWQACGADSECGALRKVMLHAPGHELSSVSDAASADWIEAMDPTRTAAQVHALAETYATHGVEVELLAPEQTPGFNHVFVRDLFTMTPQGAILSRMASTVRAGEEVAVAQALTRGRYPVILTIHGQGLFEGPDLVFFDAGCAFVATSIRSNESGAHQVTATLESMGIATTRIQTTYGCGHLDGVVSLVDRRTAVVYPTRVSYTLYETLRRHGYSVIEVPSRAEADLNMAINMVALEPGRVLIQRGSPAMIAALHEVHVAAIEVDVSEIMKGGGAVHCATGVLHREPCW